VASLFAGTGKATDSLVSVPTFSDSTQAGTYAVNVTQLATQGSLAGSAAANTTIQVETNDGRLLAAKVVGTDVVHAALADLQEHEREHREAEVRRVHVGAEAGDRPPRDQLVEAGLHCAARHAQAPRDLHQPHPRVLGEGGDDLNLLVA